MKHLLEAINRGILKGLNELNIELLTDLDGDNLDLIDSILTKSINNKVDFSIKQLLMDAILTGKIHTGLKLLINDPANFDKFKGLIKANDKKHLKKLINVGLKLFGYAGNFNWIDTSEITDMSELFYIKSKFNGHIELWDTSNVTDTMSMFNRAESFNLPIGDWNVSKVTNMSFMFYYAEKFDQDLSKWKLKTNCDTTGIFFVCPIKEQYKPKRI